MTDSIWKRVEDAGFDVDDTTAKEYLSIGAGASQLSDKIHGGYFRLLATRAVKEGSVKKAHDGLYKIVKQTHTNPSMNSIERNKATNFARTAYSVLKQLPVNEIHTTESKGWHQQRIKAKKQAVGVSIMPLGSTWGQQWDKALDTIMQLTQHSDAIPSIIKTDLTSLLGSIK